MNNISDKKLINYGEAIYEACFQEMALDKNVFVYGLGVDDPKGHYGTCKNFHKTYGKKRSFDVPLSEDALTGIGIGSALSGLRPVYVHQRMDFLLLCMNQLINMAAKLRYISSGEHSVPIVIRAAIGRSWGQGAQHSQSFQSFFMHVPGIKVIAPTTPHDAKGALIASIRDNNPVVFIEHRMLYNNAGYVPSESYEIPFGKGRVLKEGNDITIVGVSHTVEDSLRASSLLKEVGVNAEIIDPISLSPIDYDLIRKSVLKTRRLLVVDNGWTTCGFSSEIITDIAINCQNIKCERLGFVDTPCPTTPSLEEVFYPNPKSIAIKANKMCDGDIKWCPPEVVNKEITSFKGPF
ncbi:MAG: alpha-ketoacid dehydrogenase subunit beta [Gammaproteobacteria bacterium]|nr:alpha-ketoacid dehydrogenase subunit beta [Gammaproteobacteria bacterium]|tara:strand:- start:645 stop:1694 length:1050 start_codon:yes stop_codon:yes gene_type:complete